MMDKFLKVKYIDAFYISADTIEGVDLYTQKAYGEIIFENEDHITLSFINEIDSSENKKSVRGLLITKTALLENYKNSNKDIMENIDIDTKVNVEWSDIVYYENSIPEKFSTMYSEGTLVKKTETYIIIKDPITVRAYPLPVKNHPSFTPFYYVIPLSFVKKIEKQK
jgi:hypothetical protein